MRIDKNILRKEIPNPNFKERNALVILTTQRSGSTMLCRDINSLKVLGTPNEHFWNVLSKKKGKTGEELVKSFISQGNLYNSDFYSIKMMYNYLHSFGYWVSDRKKPARGSKSSEMYREFALRFFLRNFEDVTFIYLQRRNKFEQALSQYRATKTNIGHIFDGEKFKYDSSKSIGEQQLLDNIDVEFFNRIYDEKCKEERKLQLLIKKLGIDYLSLIYEEIRNDYPNYLLKIGAKAGVKLNVDSLGKRNIDKIVSDDFVLKFRETLLEKTDRKYT